ncbi:hypothetical protein MHU86_7860 [Fragilaria crotonensis]|nr:hypothetical protein MHU86_7860 [Fragilaria crotonensis]
MTRNISILLLIVASTAAGQPGPLRKILDTTTRTNKGNVKFVSDEAISLLKEIEAAWATSLQADFSMSMMPVDGPPHARPSDIAPHHNPTPTSKSPNRSPIVATLPTLAPGMNPGPTVASTPPANPSTSEVPTMTAEPSSFVAPVIMSPVSSPVAAVINPPFTPVALLSPVAIVAPADIAPVMLSPVASTPTLSIPQLQPSLKGPTSAIPDKVPTVNPASKGGKGLSGGAIAGIVLALAAVGLATAAVVWKRKRDAQAYLATV